MSDERRLLIFTGVHGNVDRLEKTASAIQSIVSGPALHVIADDFSPRRDGERIAALAGTFDLPSGAQLEREVIHLRELGCRKAPNYSTGLLYAWELALADGAEALWVVESDVVPHAGAPGAFRQAHEAHSEVPAVIAPLFVERGSTVIASFGGVDDWPEDGEDFAGLNVGSELRERDAKTPAIASIPWAHLACTWFPREVLDTQVRPDVDFPFYYLDHDLCDQIKAAGMEILVTDRAVAEHTPGGSSSLRWPKEKTRDRVREAAYEQLCAKWPHIRE